MVWWILSAALAQGTDVDVTWPLTDCDGWGVFAAPTRPETSVGGCVRTMLGHARRPVVERVPGEEESIALRARSSAMVGGRIEAPGLAFSFALPALLDSYGESSLTRTDVNAFGIGNPQLGLHSTLFHDNRTTVRGDLELRIGRVGRSHTPRGSGRPGIDDRPFHGEDALRFRPGIAFARQTGRITSMASAAASVRTFQTSDIDPSRVTVYLAAAVRYHWTEGCGVLLGAASRHGLADDPDVQLHPIEAYAGAGCQHGLTVVDLMVGSGVLRGLGSAMPRITLGLTRLYGRPEREAFAPPPDPPPRPEALPARRELPPPAVDELPEAGDAPEPGRVTPRIVEIGAPARPLSDDPAADFADAADSPADQRDEPTDPSDDPAADFADTADQRDEPTDPPEGTAAPTLPAPTDAAVDLPTGAPATLLVETLYFQRGTDTLLRASASALDRLARELLAQPAIGPLLIEGHASAEGDHAFNYALSLRRADRIYRALLDAGLTPDPLTLRPIGEIAPRDPELAPNRRVEVRLVLDPRHRPPAVHPLTGEAIP